METLVCIELASLYEQFPLSISILLFKFFSLVLEKLKLQSWAKHLQNFSGFLKNSFLHN